MGKCRNVTGECLIKTWQEKPPCKPLAAQEKNPSNEAEMEAADNNVWKTSERNQGGKTRTRRNPRDSDVLKCQQSGENQEGRKLWEHGVVIALENLPGHWTLWKEEKQTPQIFWRSSAWRRRRLYIMLLLQPCYGSGLEENLNSCCHFVREAVFSALLAWCSTVQVQPPARALRQQQRPK